MGQEITSRREYRLYSDHISGRAIAIKLYEGRGARQVLTMKCCTTYIFFDVFIQDMLNVRKIESSSDV